MAVQGRAGAQTLVFIPQVSSLSPAHLPLLLSLSLETLNIHTDNGQTIDDDRTLTHPLGTS